MHLHQLRAHLVALGGGRLGRLALLGLDGKRLVGRLIGPLQVGAQFASAALDLGGTAVRSSQVGPQGLYLVGAGRGPLLCLVALGARLAGLLMGVIQFRAQFAGPGLGRSCAFAGRREEVIC
ncbi:hypothetical protein [Xanthomonas euvesicatoria]|uniref:hypothetical protein n=1 Tax=Xanthomonas euvesicatoria TaxID=456327 RepID=UPI001E612A7D|nr:hypothetical protein [Xanthomonas euvesicatoria]